MSKLLNFLSVVLGWYIWRRTGSIVIGAVVAVVLFPLIGPLIQGIIGLAAMLLKELILLFVPAQKVNLALPRDPGTDGKGLRIFLGVKDFSGKPPKAPLPPSDFQSILAAARDRLSQNESFAYLDAYCAQNGLPVEVCTTAYKSGLRFDKAMKAWRAATDIRHFKKQRSESNFFSRALKAEDGKTEYAQAVFLFDGELPLETETPAPQERIPLERTP